MAVRASFVESKRGGQLLNCNNYLLSINSKKEEKRYWRCLTAGCKVTAVTDREIVTSSKGTHTHPPDAGLLQEKMNIAKAKQDSIDQPMKSMKSVFTDAFYGQL